MFDSQASGSNRASRFGLATYAMPALPLTMLHAPLLVYLPAFYSQQVGLSLSLTGLIFFLARAWDGIIDPLIGGWSDRTKTRWGARRPWMLAGLPALVLASWMLCMPNQDAGPIYLLIWLVVLYAALTMVQVPYWAWGAEISPDYSERNRIAGYRESNVLLGGLMAAVIPLVLLPGDKATLSNTLEVYAASIAILAPVTLFIAFGFGAREQLPPGEQARPTWRDAFNSVRKNAPFLRMLTGILLMALAYAVFNSVMILFIDHGLALQGAFLQFLFIKQMTAIISIPVFLAMANRIGKHRVLTIGGGIMTAGFVLLFFTPSGSFWVAAIGFAIIEIASAPLVTLPTSLMADVSDFGTLRSGHSNMGAYFAVLGMVQKFAYALGVAIGLGVLGALFFAPAADATGAASSVRYVALIGPAITMFIGGLLFWHFPITPLRHAIIKRRLLKRRAQFNELGKQLQAK